MAAVVSSFVRERERKMSGGIGKEVVARIRLVVNAGSAKPAPPVGPALGQAGLNIMNFCKEFNAKTADYNTDVPFRVALTAYKDKSFEWSLSSPPTSYFIKKAAGLPKGSPRPGHQSASSISVQHVYEIARLKKTDPNMEHVSLESIVGSVMGTARSMGVPVVDLPGAGPIPDERPPEKPARLEGLPQWIRDSYERRKPV